MEQTKEILEKQLQILSERSNENGIPVSDICILTRAMCMVARQLQNQSGDVQGWLASVQLSAKELADICAGQYARVRRQAETDRKKSEYLDSSS